MKRLVLVVIAVLVLGLGVIGCGQTSAPPPDIPRYTADQVIAVAKAGAIIDIAPIYRDKADTYWTASYVGNGVWRLESKVVYSGVITLSVNQWQYDENTGKLTKLQ